MIYLLTAGVQPSLAVLAAAGMLTAGVLRMITRATGGAVNRLWRTTIGHLA